VPTEDEAGPLPLAPASLFDLLDALNRVMARVPEAAVYEVQGEIYDVEDKMSRIAEEVGERGSMSFTELLLRCRARAEMIGTFMALLELIKMGQVVVVQEENFADIRILARDPEEREIHATVEPATGD
jgi:segregation and condensation protein A